MAIDGGENGVELPYNYSAEVLKAPLQVRVRV